MADVPRGKLVVISGPSGAGKTTVCRALKRDPRVAFSVSATTRTRRKGEVDGVDYHFMSGEVFDAAEHAGEFLEWATYNGNRYGTLRREMETALECGKTFLLEIEVQGTRQLREHRVEGLYVFIVPPDLDELRRRIVARGTNTPEEIESRLEIARKELEARDLYDHVIENRVIEDTIAEVRRVIDLE